MSKNRPIEEAPATIRTSSAALPDAASPAPPSLGDRLVGLFAEG